MKNKSVGYGVGMPAALYLQDFGQIIEDLFDDCPYQVGSSTQKKIGFRDVDVRLILEDEKYKEMGFGDPKYPHENAKWRRLTKALSLLGQQMTGLPIDFQIQQRTKANENDGGKRRSALFDLSRLTRPDTSQKQPFTTPKAS